VWTIKRPLSGRGLGHVALFGIVGPLKTVKTANVIINNNKTVNIKGKTEKNYNDVQGRLYVNQTIKTAEKINKKKVKLH